MYDFLNLPPCAGSFYRQLPQGTQPAGFPGTTMPAAMPSQGMPMFPLPQIGTEVPTGVPVGPTMGTFPSMPATTGVGGFPSIPGAITLPAPSTPSMPSAFTPPGQMTPLTTQDVLFTAGFLKTQIGRKVRVEFLIGTGTMTDRIGTLVGVGTSYILIRPEDTDDIMLCDLYSIKFVTIFH